MTNDGAQASGPKEEPVFDHVSALAMMANDVELLREVLNLFLDEVPNQARELGDAVENGDQSESERLAHGLKGAAINVHALRVRQKAAEIEASAQTGDMGCAEAQFSALKEELESFYTHIREFDWDATGEPPS